MQGMGSRRSAGRENVEEQSEQDLKVVVWNVARQRVEVALEELTSSGADAAALQEWPAGASIS